MSCNLCRWQRNANVCQIWCLQFGNFYSRDDDELKGVVLWLILVGTKENILPRSTLKTQNWMKHTEHKKNHYDEELKVVNSQGSPGGGIVARQLRVASDPWEADPLIWDHQLGVPGQFIFIFIILIYLYLYCFLGSPAQGTWAIYIDF